MAFMTFAKRKLAIGAAGLAVLAGTGGAYAATQSGPTTAKAPDLANEQKAVQSLLIVATRHNGWWVCEVKQGG